MKKYFRLEIPFKCKDSLSVPLNLLITGRILPFWNLAVPEYSIFDFNLRTDFHLQWQALVNEWTSLADG